MAIGVAFETEEQLRQRGTSRTPDILLSSPVGIRTSPESEWKMICWIDSKASFVKMKVDEHFVMVSHLR